MEITEVLFAQATLVLDEVPVLLSAPAEFWVADRE